MGIFQSLRRSWGAVLNRIGGEHLGGRLGRFTFGFGGTTSGKVVTERTALQTTAVFACVKVISEAVASLPLHVFEESSNGDKHRAVAHPLYNLLHLSPNKEMTAYTFVETALTHLLIYGNFYAQIIRDGRGYPVALYPLLPCNMMVERVDGELEYTYSGDSGQVKLSPWNILHVPGLGHDGIMPKLMELYNKRNTLVNSARAFLDARHTISDTLSAEDSAAYDKMEADIQALSKEIERESKLASIENSLKQPTSQPIVGQPQRPDAEAKTGRASDGYRNDMLKALRTNFRTVSNILEEGNDSNGGYLVPTALDSRLIDTLNEENIIRKLGTSIQTSGEHKINIAGTKPAASWVEEGGALVFSDPTFTQIVLDAHKLHVAIKVTEELLYDAAFDLENYIITQFGHALANAEEDAFLNGNGTGRPLGLLAATGGGQTVDTAGASVSSDDVLNLVYTLKRPYRKGASFISNDQTLASLRKLKDNNGAYLWQPSFQAGEPDRLLGYNIYTSAFFPAAATGQPLLAFGDYKYYNIGDRGTRSFAQLKELYAGNGMIGYLAKERVDGKLVLPEAVQILKLK